MDPRTSTVRLATASRQVGVVCVSFGGIVSISTVMRKKTKQTSNLPPSLFVVISGASLLLALLFTSSVIEVSRRLQETGVVNAPNSYALLSSIVLAGYVWLRAPYPVHKYRYAVIAVASILITSFSLWFFGLTS